MRQVETELDTLSPWADISGMVLAAKRMTIIADGKKHTGKAVISEEDGHVIIKVGKAKAKKNGQ